MLTLTKNMTFSHASIEYIEPFLWTTDLKVHFMTKDDADSNVSVGYAKFTIIDPDHFNFHDTKSFFPELKYLFDSIHLFSSFEEYEKSWVGNDRYILNNFEFKFATFGKIVYLKEMVFEGECLDKKFEINAFESIFSFFKEELNVYFVITDTKSNDSVDFLTEFSQLQLTMILEDLGFRRSKNHLVAAL